MGTDPPTTGEPYARIRVAVVLAALVTRFAPPVRHWAPPVAAVTVGGGLLVILVAVLTAGTAG